MNDIADSRCLAVLRTRLPYTDRRSLSQAWFSALHLAEGGRSYAPARRRIDGASRGTAVHAPLTGTAHANPRVASVRTAPPPLRLRPPSAAGDAAFGRIRAAAGRTSTAAFERARSYPPFRTSLTVGVEGARIKLLLRRDGPTLHVIALCAAKHAGLVSRALACADAHLRGRGESVRASVRTCAERA